MNREEELLIEKMLNAQIKAALSILEDDLLFCNIAWYEAYIKSIKEEKFDLPPVSPEDDTMKE